MASTQLLHGQLSYVDGAGNETIMHPESSASDILVDSKTNKNAEEGQSAIPSDVDTLQKLMK